jgi:ferredoxin-NADP reductase
MPRFISVTIKANPDGLLSSHLVDDVSPGTVIRLVAPTATLTTQSAAAEDNLVTAGSGVTPVMTKLRSLRTERMPARPVQLDFEL